MQELIAPGAALLGVALGAVIGPWATARQAQRKAVRDRFDDALGKLHAAAALRPIPPPVDPRLLDPHGADPLMAIEFDREQRARAIGAYHDAVNAARTALALVQSCDARIGAALAAGWEISEEDVPILGEALTSARMRALRRIRT